MAIYADGRSSANMIIGSRVWFIPDGTTYGEENKESSRVNVPTFEEAKATELCLGKIDTFRWNPDKKTVTSKGFSYEINRYVKKDEDIILGVNPTFTTQDVTPEAHALFYGLSSMPAIGESARPFSNASGTLRGWLYIEKAEGFRALEEDEPLAQIHLRGNLGLQEHQEENDDLVKVSYKFAVTQTPADGFRNLGIPTTM